jgi:hypothetical protein
MSSIRVTAAPQRRSQDGPSLRPLTHHDILRLVGPFTERGWQLDMAASEREERLLRFKVLEHTAEQTDLPVFCERLSVAVSNQENFLMVRELWLSSDTDAESSPTLTASGPDAGVLLDQFARVPVTRHFLVLDNVILRRSYKLEPGKQNTNRTGTDWTARIVRGTVQFGSIRAEFDAETRNLPISVRLYPQSGRQLNPPRDLLAVMGRNWRSLQDYPNHWRSTIKTATREPRRTLDIEQKIEQTVTHLAQTLAQSPTRFHERHRWSRWRASAQSGTAIFLTLGLIVGTLLLNQVADEALIRVLAFGAPPLMVLMLFFAFDHLPDFEWPRIPRTLKEDSWAVEADR